MKRSGLKRRGAGAGVAVLMTTLVAGSAQAAGEAGTLPQGPAVVAEVRRAIAENYVITDKIPAVDAMLEKGLKTGRYEVGDPRQLADRLNADLMAAAKDKHLAIQYDPVRAAMLRGPSGDEINEGPEWEQMARSRNYGFTEMRVLEGNIRYANLEGFVWTGPKTAEAFDGAMRFLKEGDAAIIDLRYNGGGSPKAIQYLISHFVEPQKPLMTFYMGGGKAPEREIALTELPAGRMIGKPVYLLTSRISISAAEAFAALVRGYGLGEIVGETTAGAAYRNSFFPIAGNYMLSVSVGRGEVAPTAGDWEGKGIAPTLPIEAAKALDLAHLSALRKLSANAPPEQRARMEGKATLIAARLNPSSPALPLSAYSGSFGDRVITLEQERLFYQRKGGPKTALVPLGGNLFVIEGDPSSKVEYAASGDRTVSLDVIRADGARQKQLRLH